MNNIIVIDTCSEELVVGLIKGTEHYTISSTSLLKKHNGVLLPTIDSLISDNGLDIRDINAIACVCGPGSFTGIRLGVTTANALASSLNIPIIPMNALEVIAYNSIGRALAIIDARHGNYYVGIYNGGIEEQLLNMTTSDVESFNGAIVSRNDTYSSSLMSLATWKYDNAILSNQVIPLYLKLSQAERELDDTK